MDTTLDKIRFTVALLLILFIVKKIWDIFYIFLIGPWTNKVDIKSYGEWAMVTGSTDGIGKGYARELAARGCNIILVSRSMDKLQAVANEIETDFGVKTKVVQIDFTADTSIYGKLAQEIDGMEIGTLVNNVGVAGEHPDYFIDLLETKQHIIDMINVNVLSMIRVTHIVLAGMVKRRKGIIINVGSSCYRLPLPMEIIYASTKAFVTKFSEEIMHEYRDQGILVQCVVPGLVKTRITAHTEIKFIILRPDEYVPKALSLLGTTAFTHGSFSHALQCWSMWCFKEYISEKFYVLIVKKAFEYHRKQCMENNK